MVTTQPSPASRTDRPVAGSPTSGAALALMADSTGADTPIQPSTTATDTFGSHLDRAALVDPVPVATAVQTAAATLQNIPVPMLQAAIPGSQLPPPTSALGRTANTGTAVTTTAEDPTDDKLINDEPIDPTLVVIPVVQPQPPPPPPLPVVVAASPTLVTSSSALAPTGSADTSATAAATGGSSQPATSPIAGSADMPTDAFLVAQSASTPTSARLGGRIDPKDSKLTATKPTNDVSQLSSSAAAALPDLSANPTLTSPLAQSIPTPATPIVQTPTQPPSIQPAATRPGVTASASSSRAAKTASEPGSAASPASSSAPSPPLPQPLTDMAASTTPSLATIVATASITPAITSGSTAPASAPGSVQRTAVPNSPASQVAQAIIEPVKVVMSNPTQAATASHVTTIQITPVELGRVDIRIERPADGPATIQLVAERPETLSRLIHDQSQLQQALDQAGVPQAGRVLDFSLAPPPLPDPGATSSFAGGNTNGGSFSNNGQQRNGSYANQTFGDAPDSTLTATTQHRSIRSGIDITA